MNAKMIRIIDGHYNLQFLVEDGGYISVDGKPIAQEAKAYYMFYKPRGVVTTMSDPQNRRSIADFVQNLPERVFPVGRLDFNTEGLLLLTNDGALAQALMHPSHEVNKTYLVKVPGIVPQEKLDQLRKKYPGVPHFCGCE